MNQKIISKAICVAARFMMVTPVASYAKTSAKTTVTVKKSSNKTVKTSTKKSVKKKVKKGLNLAKATIYVGKTKTLKLTGVKGKVKWSTSNKKVATVSAKGIVKRVKAGTEKSLVKLEKRNTHAKSL